MDVVENEHPTSELTVLVNRGLASITYDNLIPISSGGQPFYSLSHSAYQLQEIWKKYNK